jgi:short-subunit dehydrogenase
MFELNFFAALEMIQLVVPQMRRRRSGAIVNVSSVAGKVPLPWLTLYSASKYALCALGDGLRMELEPDGIRVTTVCPGFVKTGFGEHALDGRPPGHIVRSRKFAITPEECARVVIRGVKRGARTVMAPPAGWLLVGLERLVPAVVEARMARLYHRPEQAE